MNMITAKPKECHPYVWEDTQTDPLLGATWDILHCPQCGKRIQLCREPHRKIILAAGKDDLTQEDADRILALCGAGQVEEARALMERAPGHYYNVGPIQIMGLEIET